jgi:hypothetical protein
MRYALVAVLVGAASPLAAQKPDSARTERAEIMAAIVNGAAGIPADGWSPHVSKLRTLGDTAWVTVEQVWRMGPRDTSSVSPQDELHYYGHGRPRRGGVTERRDFRVERRNGQWVLQ